MVEGTITKAKKDGDYRKIAICRMPTYRGNLPLDLSTVRNPYDWANPVTDYMVFAGRSDELKEIRYYLEYGRTATKPISIALIGQRASGKTSLLNMAQREARLKGFCTVRLVLDENDIVGEANLFFKLFDSLVVAVFEEGAFGGISGKVSNGYSKAVHAFSADIGDPEFPFLFPIQYAHAMGSGNASAVAFSTAGLSRDLSVIHAQVNKPIILLFDEGNVLSKSKVHLEKLRNLFEDLPGYMLVLTGTPELFPVMGDVFSPIVRQFKKIDVTNFRRVKDTIECITKPLESIGLQDQPILDDLLTQGRDVHDVSSGNPYEIQLLCHIMFKRVQEKNATKMRLDLNVLEEVRKQLETSQQYSSRPILGSIQQLPSKLLSALGVMCPCRSPVQFDRIWAGEYLLYAESRWTKDSLHSAAEDLVERGLVRRSVEGLEFAGDDFDRIYAKYFARELGIVLNLGIPISYAEFLDSELMRWCSSEVGLTPIWEGFDPLPQEIIDVKNTLDRMANDSEKTVLAEPLGVSLYEIMIANRAHPHITIVHIKATFNWCTSQQVYYFAPDREVKEAAVEPLKARAISLGGSVECTFHQTPVIPVATLEHLVLATEDEAVRLALARMHVMGVFRAYSENDREDAFLNAELAYRFSQMHDAQNSNILGYAFMAMGKPDVAEGLFKTAIERASPGVDDPTKALAWYNLAVLHIQSGRAELGQKCLDDCLTTLEAVSEPSERACVCLFVPHAATSGGVTIDEVKGGLDLLDIAKQVRYTIGEPGMVE